MMNEQKVPQLRFSGFEDEWNDIEFGSILKESLERSVIEDEDILLSSAIEGMFLNSELFGHQRGISNIGYRKIRKNMLILSAQNLHLGNANVNIRFNHGLVSPAYKIYDICDCDPLLLSAWIKKDETKHFFLMATTEGASGCRKNVVWEDLYKQRINLPIAKYEQQKIGSFLSKIDSLIQAKAQKLESLKSVKKSLLQKCFPKDGEKVPQMRFEGFSRDWEEHLFGEFYEFKNGLNKDKNSFGNGIPIINYTDVYHNRGIYSYDIKGKVQLSKEEIKNFEIKKGDILFTRTSETVEEIGYPSVVMDDTRNTVFSGFLLRARAIKEDPLENIFKKYVFFTKEFRKEMLKKSSITTRALTSGTSIKNMYFRFPSKEEQEKIGQFFSKYDSLISLHQKEIDNLKTIKKSLLQKMFI